MQYSLGMMGLLTLIHSALANPVPDMSLVPRSPQYFIPISDPADQCCETNCHLKNVGDGNLHTDFLHTQLTEPIDCKDGDCDAVYTDTYAISFSLNAVINVAFFTGGFDVTQSWGNNKGYQCDGTAGQKVCVWMAVAHAAYTVEPNTNGYPPICGWNGQAVMRSPLKNNPGGGFYCGRGDACKDINTNYWCDGQKDC